MEERYQTKAAVFLILTRTENGKTEVLLQERCNTGYMDGKYDTSCSGHIERGESLLTATVREAKEELGIDINEDDLNLVAVIHPYEENYINMFFTTKKYTGTPKIMEPNKCSNLKWFNINTLPENIVVRVKKVIENMHKGIICDDGDFSHQKK